MYQLYLLSQNTTREFGSRVDVVRVICMVGWQLFGPNDVTAG